MPKLDLSAVENGREFQISDRIFITIKPANRRFNNRFAKERDQFPTGFESFSDARQQPYNARLWARNVVTGWRGVTSDDIYDDGNTEEVPFSVEACEAFMKNPTNDSDYRLIIRLSVNDSHYEKQMTEELIKKLPSISLIAKSKETVE